MQSNKFFKISCLISMLVIPFTFALANPAINFAKNTKQIDKIIYCPPARYANGSVERQENRIIKDLIEYTFYLENFEGKIFVAKFVTRSRLVTVIRDKLLTTNYDVSTRTLTCIYRLWGGGGHNTIAFKNQGDY